MRFSIFQDTDIGGRSINQDRMGYCFSRESLLMVLADGMGGHLRGEIAAQIAMQTVASMFQQQALPRLADPVAFIEQAFHASHRELHRYRDLHGMTECPRTTIVACVVQDGHAWWGHAGDSRLYLFRSGEVMFRTLDHSKVQSLVSLGLITEAEGEVHPERNKVLNCLGSPFVPPIEIHAAFPMKAGDVVMLCSDGLWSGVSAEELVNEFRMEPVEQAVPRLIQSALAHNGPGADNTTVLAMKWDMDSTDASGLPSLSSMGLPDGAVTTTISIGALEAAEAVDMTEDEIDKTIAEIQEAIQRSNKGI
ncbi:MAG: protein phosphatase 2C domain-containing protein [Lautropia sp.]|nr:protein phosphatase 2C domain-containing protein [Lautropia sp.]